MDDIRPPRKRPSQANINGFVSSGRPTAGGPVRPQPQPHTPPVSMPEPSIDENATASQSHGEIVGLAKPKRFPRWIWWAAGALVLVLGLVVGAWLWYNAQLSPVDADDNSSQQIVIGDGDRFADVANRLYDANLIRNTLAFDIMARLDGKRDSVKAGTCSLRRSYSAQEILSRISEGCQDFKSITFFPGATIYKSRWKPTSMDVNSVLLAAGYSQEQIDIALEKSYITEGIDLFADKPEDADLEGYIYGDTYYVATNARVEDVLQVAFNHMAQAIQKGGYVEKFKAKGLNLFQGITLASIVQRELSCTSGSKDCFEDQKKIAQVFYKRLDMGMSMGSDVTFYYGADKLGVDPAVDLKSDYNTRIHTGLTPGPIGAPGLHALDAVANPSGSDYLFFVAGDDGKVYFSRTQAEHEGYIEQHCKVLCSTI